MMPPVAPAETPLLSLQNLSTEFSTGQGVLHAVDDVSFDIQPGETLGLVGESGSGKSVTALSIMSLVRAPGRIAAGRALYKNHDLLALSPQETMAIRGKDIAMIFQEPMTSLNPVFSVGDQIAESVRIHEQVGRREAMERAIEMLNIVQIPSPRRRAHEYPHQLSGGMRQRVMIAMALACNPKLLIADEPTTALDVTIQAEILDLLNELKDRFGMAVLLITHDLGVVAGTAQRVIVMYARQIVEEASVDALFESPLHPYTQGLLRSIPRVDRAAAKRQRLTQIPGTVPILRGELRACCRFAPRCGFAKPSHFENTPPLREVRPGHKTTKNQKDKKKRATSAQCPKADEAF